MHIYSYTKHLKSTYYGTGFVLSARSTAVNKSKPKSCLYELTVQKVNKMLVMFMV
jgi:hypothetical protein